MRFPYPPFAGTDHISLNLIKALSEKHEITLICHIRSEDNVKDVPFLERYCRVIPVLFPNPKTFLQKLLKRFKRDFLLFLFLVPRDVPDNTSKEIEKCIKKILSEEEFDLVQIEYFYAAKYLKYIKNSIKVILSNDAYFLTIYQIYKFEKRLWKKLVLFWEYLAVKKYELRMYKKFDWIFFISKKDEKIIKNMIPGLNKTKVIPIGFEIEVDFNKEEEKKRSLIFVGGMRAYFNIDAMLYFCNDILPLIEKEIPEVKLYIVGENPGSKITSLSSRGNIIVTGSVPDVKKYIKTSEVYVAPLRIGTGIKTKIIEAIACSKAIVTTSVGVQGLKFENGENIIVADDPIDFANNVIVLLKNPLRRKKLSENARKLFCEHYKLESVKSKIQDVYSNLINE